MNYFENQVIELLTKNVDILDLEPSQEEGVFVIRYEYNFYQFIKSITNDYIFGTSISIARTKKDLRDLAQMKKYIKLYRNR